MIPGRVALAEVVPDPLEVVGRGTVLVDGTVCPTWDWCHVPDLFSAKAGYPGMNLQIAATLDGELAAVGPVPVHGARYDAYAFAASGLAEVLTDYPTVADLDLRRRRGNRHRPVRTIPQHRPSTPARSSSTPPWPAKCSSDLTVGSPHGYRMPLDNRLNRAEHTAMVVLLHESLPTRTLAAGGLPPAGGLDAHAARRRPVAAADVEE